MRVSRITGGEVGRRSCSDYLYQGTGEDLPEWSSNLLPLKCFKDKVSHLHN